MAVTSKMYLEMVGTSINANGGMLDYLSDTIKVALTTSTNSISQTADRYYSALTNEVTGTGYTAGGATLGTKTLATASLVTTFDAADTVWTTLTETGAAQAHVYNDNVVFIFDQGHVFTDLLHPSKWNDADVVCRSGDDVVLFANHL